MRNGMLSTDDAAIGHLKDMKRSDVVDITAQNLCHVWTGNSSLIIFSSSSL